MGVPGVRGLVREGSDGRTIPDGQTRDLVLLGLASNGTTDQWDGLKTVKGVLLRWLQKPGVGFPENGYDIRRAPVTVATFPQLVWSTLAPDIGGKTLYDHKGEVTIESRSGLSAQGGVLVIPANDRITLSFPDPASYLEIVWPKPPAQAKTSPGPVQVELFAGGQRRAVHTLTAGQILALRTRGIDRVELTATKVDGLIGDVRYGLLNAPRSWEKVAHVCLPISDAKYPCGPPFASTEEDEAKRRVPAGVDWNKRYSSGFKAMRPYLAGLATGQPASFPASTDPDAPKATMDPQTSIMLAALDPHIARAVGLAWDDTSIALDGREWAYKVTGTWGRHRFDVRPTSQEVWDSVRAEVAASGEGGLTFTDGTLVTKTRAVVYMHPEPGEDVTLTVRNASEDDQEWIALPSGWGTGKAILGRGVLQPSSSQQVVHIEAPPPGAPTLSQVHFISPWGQAIPLVLYRVVIGSDESAIERSTILPSVIATEPAPLAAPGWTTARADQRGEPSDPLRASLEWELRASSSGAYDEHAPVLFQVGGRQLSTDPTVAQPAAPAFEATDLLNDKRPVLVPTPTVAAKDARRRYWTDTDLKEGWRCWWVRGIDLFGRVGPPSPPAVLNLEDNARPPAPPLVHAEYVQADMDAGQAALLGRSPLAREWLAANPKDDAVVAVWAWTPELEEIAPDVNGFRVYVRRPVGVANPGPNDPTERYEGVSWGPACSEVGPIPVRLEGIVKSVTDDLSNVTIKKVTSLDDTHSACATDLTIDAGGGALFRAALTSGKKSYLIVGNGEGTGVTLTVEHPKGLPPSAGAYGLYGGFSGVVKVTTTIAAPPLTGTGLRRRVAGALVTSSRRFQVLAEKGGTFLCVQTSPTEPVGHETATWYPAYAIAIADTGFGPNPSSDRPTARAQVMVASVRRWSRRPLQSPEGAPGGLMAVDVTPPQVPSFDLIPSGLHCAQVATRADWYGVSRVTLTWPASKNLDYVVYRALGDAVFKLDRVAHETTPHDFARSSWPPELWADRDRRKAVQADLDALDAVLESGTDEEIAAAYEGLRAGTQQLIAGQPAVEDAYVPLNGKPLDAGPFVDELDGRSRAHWFYRLAARSRSGMESAKSLPTPPICCPDVVPPAAPLAHLALAAEGAVKLQWQRSPEPDLARYLVYRTDDEVAAADVRTMVLVAKVAGSSTGRGAPGDKTPLEVAGTPWLEYSDPVPGGREVFYKLVALDTAGNASPPSRVLRGRALVSRPTAPTWQTPVRGEKHVALAWTHASQKRLSCLVERRSPGGFWTSASGWLPRGVYTFEDVPPDLGAGWEYRLSVRDPLGQTAPTMPTALLKASV